MNSATSTADYDDLGQLLTEAGDPNTTDQRLRDLLSLNHPEVTVAVAKNIVLTGDELAELSQHPDLQVRLAVAGNPSSDGHILEQLATDPEPAVLVGLANNPQITSNLLAGLSESKSLQVKTAVAKNIRTPVAGLLSITQEIDRGTAAETFPLRQALVNNSNSPNLILLKCLNRNDPPDLQENIALQLSCHLNSPDELLDGLAEYNSLPIQENIVNHPNIHHATLVKLASSSFWSIQQQALQRINAAPATIDRQTYIGEAEESVDSNSIEVPAFLSRPDNEILYAMPQSELLDVALISSEDLYQPPPVSASEWDGRTALSELYERTGAQLNAIHPLAILFTILTLLCVALSLNAWISSTTKQVVGNALTPNGAVPSPKPTPAVKFTPKSEASNYYRAINIANLATLASQTASTKQDWGKISGQWNKAIVLLKAIPASDPQYPKAQNKLSEYQTINNVAKNKAR